MARTRKAKGKKARKGLAEHIAGFRKAKKGKKRVRKAARRSKKA